MTETVSTDCPRRAAMPKLPKFEEWQAPWEKSGTEFDAEKAKKFIYDLHTDAEKATEAHKAKVDELTTANTELQTKVTEFTKATETATETAAREAKEAQDRQLAETTKDADLRVARLEVGIELGLSKDDLPRIVGSTKEELLADGQKFLETYKAAPADDQTFESVNRRGRNPLNPEGGGDGASTDQILKAVPRL
jgi:hypothetical protein